MAEMDWFSLLAAAAPLVASGIGEATAAGDDNKAEDLRRVAMEQFNIDLPPVQEISARYFESKAETAHNPEAQQSRMEALRMLGERAKEGYNVEDRAAINDALSEVNQRERGQRMAIEQNLDPNSGAMLAAKLANQQAGAQRANQQGLDIAAGSRAQALKALQMQEQVAGGIEDDEFRRGQAGDAMAQFNENNRIGGAKWNAGQADARFGQQFDLGRARSSGALGDSKYFASKGDKKRQNAAIDGALAQDVIRAAGNAYKSGSSDGGSTSTGKTYTSPPLIDAYGNPVGDDDEWGAWPGSK